MANERTRALAEFVGWAGEHITGDEKGEAQSFLDRLFRAFGHDGVKEAGAAFEVRIPKAEGKGKKFADLLREGRVLIEMKRRGEGLRKHFRQVLGQRDRANPFPFDRRIRRSPGNSWAFVSARTIKEPMNGIDCMLGHDILAYSQKRSG